MKALWQNTGSDAGMTMATWAADTLVAAGLHGDGLYVATASAGGRESVEFLRDGLATGLAFANPRLFPWSLANSPTGAIARALGVRGPTYTLLGAADAVAAAFEHAAEDLADGVVRRPLVVALDADEERWSLAAVTFEGGPLPVLPADQTAAGALGRLVETTTRDWARRSGYS